MSSSFESQEQARAMMAVNAQNLIAKAKADGYLAQVNAVAGMVQVRKNAAALFMSEHGEDLKESPITAHGTLRDLEVCKEDPCTTVPVVVNPDGKIMSAVMSDDGEGEALIRLDDPRQMAFWLELRFPLSALSGDNPDLVSFASKIRINGRVPLPHMLCQRTLYGPEP